MAALIISKIRSFSPYCPPSCSRSYDQIIEISLSWPLNGWLTRVIMRTGTDFGFDNISVRGDRQVQVSLVSRDWVTRDPGQEVSWELAPVVSWPLNCADPLLSAGESERMRSSDGLRWDFLAWQGGKKGDKETEVIWWVKIWASICIFLPLSGCKRFMTARIIVSLEPSRQYWCLGVYRQTLRI